MSSILVELTANIVSSHASTVEMSSDELLVEIQRIYNTLKNLDSDVITEQEPASKESVTKLNPKKSILKDQIICLECGKGGFKTLSRHLKQAHGMKAAEYRKKYEFPAKTALAAKNYSEARRQTAINNNLGEKMTEGRIKHQAEMAAKKQASGKTKKQIEA